MFSLVIRGVRQRRVPAAFVALCQTSQLKVTPSRQITQDPSQQSSKSQNEPPLYLPLARQFSLGNIQEFYLGRTYQFSIKPSPFDGLLPKPSSAEAKPELLSRHLTFRSAFDSPMEQSRRPIAIVFGWLVAKAKHIHKYGDFYLGNGFDVLHVKIDLSQFLWPSHAHKVVQQCLEFLNEPERRQQPVLIHGFSVGAYVYGELLAMMQDNEKYRDIGDRLVGQILDSPVDFDGVPLGIARALTNIPLAQNSIYYSVNGFLKLFHEQVTKHYMHASATHHKNPYKIPSLWLYSSADPVVDPAAVDKVMDMWRERGLPVYSKMWTDSPHVSHFHVHPIEYIGEMNRYLYNIGLVKDIPELRQKPRQPPHPRDAERMLN